MQPGSSTSTSRRLLYDVDIEAGLLHLADGLEVAVDGVTAAGPEGCLQELLEVLDAVGVVRQPELAGGGTFIYDTR